MQSDTVSRSGMLTAAMLLVPVGKRRERLAAAALPVCCCQAARRWRPSCGCGSAAGAPKTARVPAAGIMVKLRATHVPSNMGILDCWSATMTSAYSWPMSRMNVRGSGTEPPVNSADEKSKPGCCGQ